MRATRDELLATLAERDRRLTEVQAENHRLREAVRFHEERDAHFARALNVADGGTYRADWDGAIRRLVAAKDALDRRNDQLLALVGLMARCRNVRASLRCGARLELEINCNDAFGIGAADAEPFTLDDVPAILAHLDRDPRDGDLRWVMERRKARGEAAHPSPSLAARLAGKP